MHDDQFTATGPHRPESAAGFEAAAFSTHPEDMGFQWGVRAVARRCGVTGQTIVGGIAGVLGDGRRSQFGVLGTATASTSASSVRASTTPGTCSTSTCHLAASTSTRSATDSGRACWARAGPVSAFTGSATATPGSWEQRARHRRARRQ